MSVELSPMSSASLPSYPTGWRGFGGNIPTLSSVEFDRQLDKAAAWLEQWNHEQRCALVEKLLVESDFKQIQLVWTVIQPAMHRDFMYAAKKEFPAQNFIPISTHTTRELRRKTVAMRQDNYHRIGSAHLQHYNQVKDVNQQFRVNHTGVKVTDNEVKVVDDEDREEEVRDVDPELRLPSLPSGSVTGEEEEEEETSRREEEKLGSARKLVALSGHSQGHWKSQSMPPTASRSLSNRSSYTRALSTRRLATLHPRYHSNTSLDLLRRHHDNNYTNNNSIQAAIFDGEMRSALSKIYSSPPCLRFIEMPMRRHIQDEESPRVRESSNLSSLSTYSLRERKKNKNKPKNPFVENSIIPKDGRQLISWYIDDWDTQQRNEFLHKFLLKLDPRQHYFISSFLAIRQHRDFISLLSDDLALNILSYLHPFDIVRASKTSKTWYRLCNNNNLWHWKCLETKLEIPVEIPAAGKDKDAEPDWKRMFRENMFVKLNWKTGKCNIIDCKGHTDKVLSVTFDRKRLATGSQDRSIKVWSLKDGRCLQTLTGHLKGVWSLCFFAKNLLISGSYDTTIKVWNLREGTCLRTLLSHEGPVWCMVLRENLLVSGSQDRTAKVWDIGKTLLLLTLRGHNGAVFAVDMDPKCRMVFTASADKTVRIWDAVTGKSLRTVYASNTTSIMAVSYSHGHLACCFGNSILLYSVNTDTILNTGMQEHQASQKAEPERKKQAGRIKRKVQIKEPPARKPVKLVTVLEEHWKRIETLQLTVTGVKGGKVYGHIVSAGKDGELKYWDTAKGKSIQTYSGSKKGINCIHCDETRIATASLDNKVKIYDFNIS